MGVIRYYSLSFIARPSVNETYISVKDTDAWYRAKFNEVMAVTSRQSNDLAVAKEEVSSGLSFCFFLVAI